MSCQLIRLTRVIRPALRSFDAPPLVYTCKDKLVDGVVDACREANCENKMFNVGHFKHRSENYLGFLEDVREALDQDVPVILHCRAGIHRAPICFFLCMLFLVGMSLQGAIDTLRAIRAIDIQGIMHGRIDRRGAFRHGMREPLQQYAAQAIRMSQKDRRCSGH